MVNDNENAAKNEKKSHRYDKNRLRPRNRQKFTKYEVHLIMMMVIGIKSST